MEKGIQWIKKGPDESFLPNENMKKKAWIANESIYEISSKDPVAFWEKKASEGIHWFKKWNKAYEWNPPYFKWFIGAKVNACYNALDRHMNTPIKDKIAIIWEPEPTNEESRKITYHELYKEVNKFANVLKSLGVKKRDRVGIYLPMIPEVQIAMLACARIGAIHSVVFSAFSSISLKDRMIDAEAKVLITSDGYYRKGKIINLKEQADQAIEGTKIEKVVVVKRTGLYVNIKEGRDFWWHELIEKADDYCKSEEMDSEDILFILYTSGTTGKPKGIVHGTGGFITQAYWTTKWDFDIHDEDIFWCTADIGWVTGHTYGCYGPLLVGATMLQYEGSPDYPDYGRFWSIIEEHGVTILYTAPTAIRIFIQWGDEWPKKYDLSSLRLLGTVGEPIDKDAWMWYFNIIGGGRCPVIDTWWQTETGGTLINALPGIGPFIPTVAGKSFPGTVHDVLDESGNPVPFGEGGYLVQKSPFAPGMLRGVWKDPQRYKENYFGTYGDKYYFTSDGARVWDKTGNIRLTGRVDDVMKIAGHRISTAELENAINTHEDVTECAVVPAPDKIKGQVPVAFVITDSKKTEEQLFPEVIKTVEKMIGPIARPTKIYVTDALPKTRSGKIMRRVLKKLINNEPIGDTTTLANPESVDKLKGIVGYKG